VAQAKQKQVRVKVADSNGRPYFKICEAILAAFAETMGAFGKRNLDTLPRSAAGGKTEAWGKYAVEAANALRDIGQQVPSAARLRQLVPAAMQSVKAYLTAPGYKGTAAKSTDQVNCEREFRTIEAWLQADQERSELVDAEEAKRAAGQQRAEAAARAAGAMAARDSVAALAAFGVRSSKGDGSRSRSRAPVRPAAQAREGSQEHDEGGEDDSDDEMDSDDDGGGAGGAGSSAEHDASRRRWEQEQRQREAEMEEGERRSDHGSAQRDDRPASASSRARGSGGGRKRGRGGPSLDAGGVPDSRDEFNTKARRRLAGQRLQDQLVQNLRDAAGVDERVPAGFAGGKQAMSERAAAWLGLS